MERPDANNIPLRTLTWVGVYPLALFLSVRTNDFDIVCAVFQWQLVPLYVYRFI